MCFVQTNNKHHQLSSIFNFYSRGTLYEGVKTVKECFGSLMRIMLAQNKIGTCTSLRQKWVEGQQCKKKGGNQ
jgi:hypothetical protein